MNERYDVDPYDYTGKPTDWAKLYPAMKAHIEKNEAGRPPAEVSNLLAELLDLSSRDEATDRDLAEFARRIGYAPPATE